MIPQRSSHIRSYVLRQGRISNAQQRCLDTLLPIYGIPYLCGMGETTAAIAQSHPQNDYLALEVHTPGVGSLLKQIEESGLKNIRIIQHDAVEVLRDMLVDNVLDGVHIFFPDP